MSYNNNVKSAIVLLITIAIGCEVSGKKYCSDSWNIAPTMCDDDQFCCGLNDDRCCDYNDINNAAVMVEQAFAFVILVMVVCAIFFCCFRCCRRTSNPGFVYSPANTTPVTVTVPPQQVQAPYPSMMPYPQQTPYPTQQPSNPYFGGPPPPYNVVQGSFQNASAPTL